MIKICKSCLKEFNASYRGAVYCSRKCNIEEKRRSGFGRRNLICGFCGKAFDRILARIRGKKTSFCSRRCSARYRSQKRMGLKIDPENYIQNRHKKIELMCPVCKKKRTIGAHYIRFSKRKTNACFSCTRELNKEKLRRLMINRWKYGNMYEKIIKYWYFGGNPPTEIGKKFIKAKKLNFKIRRNLNA